MRFRRPTMLLWVLLLLGTVVIAGAGYGGYYWYETPDRETERCYDPAVGKLVGQAFDNSNLARFEKVHAMTLQSISQSGFDRAALLRRCMAILEVSDHSHVNLAYTLHPAGDQIELKLSILRSAEPSASSADR